MLGVALLPKFSLNLHEGTRQFTHELREVVCLGVVKLGIMPDPWSFLEMTILIGKQ